MAQTANPLYTLSKPTSSRDFSDRIYAVAPRPELRRELHGKCVHEPTGSKTLLLWLSSRGLTACLLLCTGTLQGNEALGHIIQRISTRRLYAYILPVSSFSAGNASRYTSPLNLRTNMCHPHTLVCPYPSCPAPLSLYRTAKGMGKTSSFLATERLRVQRADDLHICLSVNVFRPPGPDPHVGRSHM